MAELPIRDFVFRFGAEHDLELEQYALFTLNDDPKSMGGRLVCRLNAKDVAVRRPAGMAFWNFLRGKPTIIGQLDLDKLREASFAKNLWFTIRQGTPSVYAVFPDNYEDLPESFKSDMYFGYAFQLAYKARKSDENRKAMLLGAGEKDIEVYDMLMQSRTKENEYYLKMYDWLNKSREDAMKQAVEKKLGDGGDDMPQY